MTNELKLKIYPAVIGALGLCLLASLLIRVEIRLPSEPIAPSLPTAPDDGSERGSSDISSPLLTSPEADPSISPLEIPTPSPLPSPLAESELPSSVGITAIGQLRVSNQTNYPIRVALLHQQTDSADPPEEINSETGARSTFVPPVHWDFAPEEGRAKGLLLSLPDRDLQLQAGDILVAFAQDGSRRYWGPYVVGETPFPSWNAEANEWRLILQP